MDWRWYLTPTEPKWLYMLMVGVLVFGGMVALGPLYQGNVLITGLIGAVVGGLSGVIAKLILVRFVRKGDNDDR